MPPPSHFRFFLGGGLLVVVEGEWVGCLWWCESGRSQPDQRRHSCSLRHRYLLSSPRPSKNKTKKKYKNKPKPATAPPLQRPTDTLPGMTASTSTCMLTHNRTLRPVSLSRSSFSFSFFCLFSLFGDFLLFFLLGKRRNFFFSSFKWEQRGRWLIVKGWGGGGV